MAEWADFPWAERMFADADESILSKAVATVHNGYSNQAGGHSRFPGIVPFASGLGGQRSYLTFWQNDLICVTNLGRVYRIDQTGNATDITGVPVSGGKRVIFAATDDRLTMTAGGQIIQIEGAKTSILSTDAPLATHVTYISGYLIANASGTGQFYYSDPGNYTSWPALNVFTADAKPDPIVALGVTPYGEIMVAGQEHIEQYELIANGKQPFTRRWSTGQGVQYPYTLVLDYTGTYGVNSRFEFVRFYGQITQNQGGDIGLVLENVDDWTDAWAAEVAVKGLKCMVLQAPNATNVYATKGVTLLLDYQNRKWSFLFGWDNQKQRASRWPAWSLVRAWGQIHVGIPGGVGVLDPTSYSLLGQTYPFVVRSGHVDKFGPSRIDEVRLRLKRGVGSLGANRPQIGMRVNRDNEGFDQFEWEDLGAPGERDMTIRFGGQGIANTWQFEFVVTDDVPVEIVRQQIFVERMRW